MSLLITDLVTLRDFTYVGGVGLDSIKWPKGLVLTEAAVLHFQKY